MIKSAYPFETHFLYSSNLPNSLNYSYFIPEQDIDE